MKSFGIAILTSVFAFSAFAMETPTESAALSGITKIEIPKKTSPLQILMRDGAIGLGAGALAGLSFMLLSGSPQSTQGNAINNEALAVGLTAGFLGGLSFGVWEINHQKSLKLSVAPGSHLQEAARLTATFQY